VHVGQTADLGSGEDGPPQELTDVPEAVGSIWPPFVTDLEGGAVFSSAIPKAHNVHARDARQI
jgi:hypothetical protein